MEVAWLTWLSCTESGWASLFGSVTIPDLSPRGRLAVSVSEVVFGSFSSRSGVGNCSPRPWGGRQASRQAVVALVRNQGRWILVCHLLVGGEILVRINDV